MGIEDIEELQLDGICIKKLEVGQEGSFVLEDEGQSVSRHVQLRDSQGNLKANAQVNSPSYIGYGGSGLINYLLTVTEVFP